MRIVLVLRLTLFIGVCTFLVCGCQGGGSPALPSLTDNAAPSLFLDRGGSGEPAKPAVPKLRWMITEPADLLEEGWGHYPATVAASITFAASLWGTNADEFDGTVNLTVDGEPYPFDCTGKTLTAQIAGLGRGMHHVQVHAGSAVGIDNRTFSFVVVDSPPFMQVGIGEDGKVYATLSRKMPASQLGDLTRWTCEKFSTDKVSVEMLSDNRTVALGMADPLSVDDMSWLPPDGSSPVVRFESLLGDVVGKLLPEADKDSDSESRSAQSGPGCEEGAIYGHRSEGHCDPDLDWFIERHSLESSDSEPRAVFNTEVPIPVMGWPPLWYPWRNCYNLVIARHNWVAEGHLDPLNSWNAEYDTVWHASQSEPYFGNGQFAWQLVFYERDHSYYPPSWCSYGWWSFEVDGNWCDPEIPAYFKSKGSWNGEGFDDGPIFVDHDPPFFGDNIEDPYGGIDVLLGSELDQSSDPYIASLYADLVERGNLYKSNGALVISQQDFWLYYWSNVGCVVADDELVVVVRAQDKPSDQGRYINKFLAGDYTYLGQNYADDEMAEHLFYADVSPYAPDELTEEYWPVPVGEQIVPMRLPTDGDEKGEFSVWILPVDCALLNGDISSFRLRTTDDINNWRRSPEFITAIPDLEIVQPSGCGETPDDRCQFLKDDTIVFEAAMTGVDELFNLTEVGELIQWFVLQDNGQGGWNELNKEQYQEKFENHEFESVITQESWTGPSFTVLLEDHEFQVRARLIVCGLTFHDDCFVENRLVLNLMFRGDRYPDPSLWDDECHYDFTPWDSNHVAPDARLSDTHPGDGFVVHRPTSNEELPLYALLSDHAQDYRIEVTVTAPYDKQPNPDSIRVYLYELAQDDPNRNEIVADFNCGLWISEPPYVYYVYGRGDHMYNPAIIGVPQSGIPNIRITDSQTSSPYPPTVEFSTPLLYVSNHDADPDYSRLVANDPEDPWWQWNLAQMREWVVPGAHYGENRGYFALDNYDGEDGQQNYMQSVLNVGQEVIEATVSDRKATLPVQSMPDIAFMFCHGGPSTYLSIPPDPTCDHYIFQFSWWPTQPGLSPQGSEAYITPYTLRDACPLGSDTEWIALVACYGLNRGNYRKQGIKLGFDDWEYIIRRQTPKQTSITTVCGFGGLERSFPNMGVFTAKFSECLTSSTGGYDSNHWDRALGTTKPREKVVIAWMEAAIYYIKTCTWNSGGLMQNAICVSSDETWILHNFGSSYRHDWRAKIL